MTTQQTVADSIDKLMHDQGKRNTDLAELLGISRQMAGNLRKGSTRISTGDLATVAKWLGVSTDSLITGYTLVPLAA